MSLHELALILVALTVGGALLAWRTAPAITVALLSGLVGAVSTARVTWLDGPEGLPGEVALWFSLGLWVGAILGAAISRRSEFGKRPMARWAASVLLAAPFACVALTLSLQDACPLYVETGICDYMGNDLLGGWITGVVFFFAIDLLVITTPLWFAPGPSSGRAADGETARSECAGVGRLAIGFAWVVLAVAILAVAFTRHSELEAWRAAQSDAESFAPNLLAAPLREPVFGCPFAARGGGHLPGGGLDPERGQWLDGHAPRWLPDDFGLVDWLVAENGWYPDVGNAILSQSVGVWGDGGCRRVSLALFWGNPHAPRFGHLYTVVDEVGDWDIIAGPGCKRPPTADNSCLHYVAWSNEERGEGERVLGLRLQMAGIDRETGDRIALGIPV